MKKTKDLKNTNKGITLIALVITIIVMLILVAVTITMAVNGGLFDYARKAGQETNKAIEKEQQLADLEANLTVDDLIDKYTTQYTLSDLGLEIGDEIDYNSILEDAEDYTAPANKTGYDSDGDEDLTDEAGQTFEQEKELTWQVMRQKGDNIILVASQTSEEVYLQGAEGYLYGPSELNNICKALYSYRDEEENIIYEARSMNEEDMLYLSSYNPDSYKVNDEYYGEKLSDIVQDEENTNYPYDNNGTARIGQGFPDRMVYDSYNFSIDDIEATFINKELLFINEDACYWLASSCVYAWSNDAAFDVRCVDGSGVGTMSMYISNDTPCNPCFRFRPVISLPSAVVKAIIEAEQ